MGTTECKDEPVEKCKQVQRKVCSNDFLEEARSSKASNEKDVAKPIRNSKPKKCKDKSSPNCKTEKKKQCKNEPVQKCKKIERKICSNTKDLLKVNKRKLKSRMCKNVCDYTYSCKDCK